MSERSPTSCHCHGSFLYPRQVEVALFVGSGFFFQLGPISLTDPPFCSSIPLHSHARRPCQWSLTILSPLFPPGHFRPFASFLFFPGVSSQRFRSRQVSSMSHFESTRSFLHVMSCPVHFFLSPNTSWTAYSIQLSRNSGWIFPPTSNSPVFSPYVSLLFVLFHTFPPFTIRLSIGH